MVLSSQCLACDKKIMAILPIEIQVFDYINCPSCEADAMLPLRGKLAELYPMDTEAKAVAFCEEKIKREWGNPNEPASRPTPATGGRRIWLN